jgi:hypothetical protein
MGTLTRGVARTAIIAAGTVLALSACANGATNQPLVRPTPTGSVLPDASGTAGPVEVAVRNPNVTQTGASFTVELSNHAIDLSDDMARTATLSVDGRAWGATAWAGDPPGGHHRTGTLSFTGSGQRTGPIVLTVFAGGRPAVFTWKLP